MKIEKNVKIYEQNNNGTLCVSIPKQFAYLLNFNAKDTVTFVLDTETETLSLYKKSIQ